MTDTSSTESGIYSKALPKIFAIAIFTLFILGWYYHNQAKSEEMDGGVCTLQAEI